MGRFQWASSSRDLPESAALDHSVITSSISAMDDATIDAAVQGLVDRGADGIILPVPMIQLQSCGG